MDNLIYFFNFHVKRMCVNLLFQPNFILHIGKYLSYILVLVYGVLLLRLVRQNPS